MDLNYSPDELAFRDEVRGWLRTNLPADLRQKMESYQDLTKDELLHSFFLKPPSAVIGPGDDVVIPPGATGVFPEIELCVVIGRRSRNLTLEQAPAAIFGYSILLDITARNYGPEKSGHPSPGERGA